MSFLKSVIDFFCEILFGCRHYHLTRPFTLEDETYKVCLDCGRKVLYSAEEMRTLNALEARRLRAAHAGELKVMPVVTGGPQLVPVRANHKTAA